MIDYPREGRTDWRRFVPSWKLAIGLVLGAGVAVVALFALAVVAMPVPKPNDVAIAETTKVLYADGKHEIGRLGDVRRTSVPLDQVPEHVRHAVLAAEDRDFYDHGGFSFSGIGRALWNNLTGGLTQGGSTITQQYVKNAFLSQEQTILRKLNELILAVKLETVESKDQILEDYLNTIYFGRGAYGIEAAAEAYFGTTASKLTVAQGAALAAIIQSPGNYEPELYRERLVERWNYVLDGMVDKGWLAADERATVKFPKFRKQAKGNQLTGQTGYILEAVKRQLRGIGWSDADIERGGLTITTTIQRETQAAAVAAVQQAGPQYNTEGVRIGVVAVEPGTGHILGLYGGRDYLEDQLDNALQAHAQGGSTFKAFTLTAAMEQGYSLYDTLDGTSPQTIEGYTLQNFGNSSYGYVSLLSATQYSVNTAYVNLEAQVGVDASIDTAQRLGLPDDTPGVEDNLTFVLGSASPRPVDMANAFATLAARGVRAEPTIVLQVQRNTGEVAYQAPSAGTRTVDQDAVDSANQALQAVVSSGTATRASWIGRPVAGKTGTTDEAKSAWFVGYTPQFAAAVMMTKENKKGEPVSLNGVGGNYSFTGGSFPTAIWAEFAAAALADQPVEDFASPGGSDYIPAPQTPPQSPAASPSLSPTASPAPTGSPTAPTAPPTGSPAAEARRDPSPVP